MQYWRIWQCSKGHLFTSPFLFGASLKSLRLGVGRYERCPECHHFRMCTLADETGLTDGQRRQAAAHKTSPIP